MFNCNHKEKAAEINEFPITFGSHGLKLKGKVFLPKNANIDEPIPGAVLCHGFGAARRVMKPSARIMAAQGVATLIFDLRGHGSSDGAIDGKMADDVIDAWNYLSQIPEVDSTRMGLVGHSLGAMSVILAAERVANPRALVVLACPPEVAGKMSAEESSKIGRWGQNYNHIVEYPKNGAFPWLKGIAAIFCMAWMYLGRFKVRVDWQKFLEVFPQMKMSEVLRRLGSCSKLFVFCEGDKVTPFEKSAFIYETACQPKELLLVKGGLHTTPLLRGNLRAQWTSWTIKTLKEQ
ncbi:MAG: alpha/beta fold hydrolase [Chloroflexota bacterium]|nr:MAG: alpha/beta fold hydrolase [Chloroflexota bacterium]